jgi:hypothetical protein
MKISLTVAGVGLTFALFTALHGGPRATAADPPQAPDAPGAVERAALAKVDFLVGDWEGEGWSTPGPGERRRFWVKEYYHYRGDKDLMDMEGRFGRILPDGTSSPEQEYALGILFYDRQSGRYMMWHYSTQDGAKTVPMDVNVDGRSMQYVTEYAPGKTGRFHLVVGADGVWVSTFTILTAEKTWQQVMEFRMKRIGP